MNYKHYAAGLDISKISLCDQLVNICIFFNSYCITFILVKKLYQNLLARLAALLAPGCWALGSGIYVEPCVVITVPADGLTLPGYLQAQ